MANIAIEDLEADQMDRQALDKLAGGRAKGKGADIILPPINNGLPVGGDGRLPYRETWTWHPWNRRR